MSEQQTFVELVSAIPSTHPEIVPSLTAQSLPQDKSVASEKKLRTLSAKSFRQDLGLLLSFCQFAAHHYEWTVPQFHQQLAGAFQ